MMKRVYLILILLISTLLILVTGCKSEPKTTELIPANIDLMASIQISKIINDQDLRDAYDKTEKEADQPQTFEEALDELFQESGIDIRDFSSGMIFADIGNMDQYEYVGFIAEGNFNETELINKIEENTGEEFSTSDYQGYKLYTSEAGDFSITFLNDSMLLGGSTQAVKDSIAVSKGEGEPIEGKLLDTLNRYNNTMISVAMMVPENLRDELVNESMTEEIPFSLDAFRSIDMIGASLDKENSILSYHTDLHFLEEDSVQNASDTLSGLITMLKGMAGEPDTMVNLTLKELLGNIEVSAAGSWLSISYEIELSQLEALIEKFNE